MAKYYIARIKSGQAVTPNQDQVVFWYVCLAPPLPSPSLPAAADKNANRYRIHPKTSCASSIRNADFPDDAVFAWALVSQPAKISMSVGSNQFWEFSADPSGPSMFSVPFPADLGSGATPEVAIMRGEEMVQWGQGSMAITTECERANFNPVVGQAGPGL